MIINYDYTKYLNISSQIILLFDLGLKACFFLGNRNAWEKTSILMNILVLVLEFPRIWDLLFRFKL